MSSLGFSGKSLSYQDVAIEQGPGSFWPDLNLGEFQLQRKVPPQLQGDTAIQAVLSAIGDINRRLKAFEADKRAEGYQKAADLPGARVASENQTTAQYKKAVYAIAKADLLGEVTSLSRLGTGNAPEGTSSDVAESFARGALLTEASQAVRAILGLGRATVSLS
ncbi:MULTISPECIES: head completion/stabilization protein [Serratia]|uniref:head completion/stabilization protein n=1 Tax=Serratia TaxID=613 RepID=UPI001F35771D|nr:MULTISPECIES: head completion/stabilization protein [Serratia]MEB6337895.1 head completion/stabilization protein [Serratia rhizosphaerae]